MVKIKALDASAKKWGSRASLAGDDFESGVKGATWQANAASEVAETNYKTGVTAAVNAKRRQTGINAVSDATWKDLTTAKGKDRYTSEVGQPRAQTAYSSGFKPYHDVISGLTLTDVRGARGAETNYNRSKQVGKALHDARIGAAK